MISRLEMLEDFTKLEYADNKISKETANEQLRIIKETKDIGID